MKAFTPILLATLIWACSPNFSAAQNPVLPPSADAASARQLLAEALVHYDSNQFERGLAFAERAYIFFKQIPAYYPGELAESAFQAGRGWYSKENYEEAQQRFEEASNAWALQFPAGAPRTADAIHFVSRCLYALDESEDALLMCTKAYDIRQSLQPSNPCDLVESLRLMGNIHLQLSEYAKAKDYYNDALPLAIDCAGAESTQVADVLANLGVAFLRLQDFEQSIAIQERALIIRQKRLSASNPDIARSYMILGENYKKLLKFDEALFYYEKALEIQRKNIPNDDMAVAYAYSEIGQYFLAQKDYLKAQDYFEKENTAMLALKAEQSSSYAFTCGDLGRLYLANKDYPKAIEWHEKMVDVWRKSHKHPDTQLGSMLTILGKSRMTNGDFAVALIDYQEAKQIYENLLGANNFMASKADLGLANIYRKWYLKDGQDSLLEKCRAHYILAVNGVETQLPKEYSAIGQRKILAESRPILERAISAEMLALKAHSDQLKALENAWHLSETAHGYMLLAATQEANARRFSGIPGTELIRDSLLKVQITVLEIARKSALEHGLSLTDSLILAQNAQIFAYKEEAQQIKAIFEKNYPDYFHLKYELQTSSLQKTQQLLSPTQTLLEYFVGDFDIFIFVVQQKGSRMIEIPRDFPLDDWTKQLREGISNYYTAKQKEPEQYEKTVRQYADAAQKLYKKLLAPIADSLTSEIIIVPGDGLANLPFEALLSAEPKVASNFSTYPFFLRKHSVQYAYSATMLHQMTARTHLRPPTGELLAFAPFFEEDTTSLALRLQRDDAVRLGFSALPFSGEEVFRAKKRYSERSKVLTGKLATKQKFLEMAGQYKVIHLATHGKANHLAGDFSFLAFATEDDKLDKGLLSVGELYNLSLNADLVLLSACETGIGEQQRGEGVVSLARAFAFAGAKSIVASLWSVNDKSTMQVMDNFYAGIKSGQPKNIALANAKLEYLAQNPGQASHPFFWAGFVGVGDLGAMGH